MTTPESAKAEPTWGEIVGAALPAHAHISHKPLNWRAHWSTPVGIWTVSHESPLIRPPVTIVTGPWHTAEFRDAPALFVVELLRTFGAIA